MADEPTSIPPTSKFYGRLKGVAREIMDNPDFSDSDVGLKKIFNTDEDFVAEEIWNLRGGAESSIPSKEQIKAVKDQFYNTSQEYLKELGFPEQIKVYRMGRLHGDEVASFSVNPKFSGSSLPWASQWNLPVHEYTVNREDILAAPNAVLNPNLGSSDEEEVLIRGSKVTLVGEPGALVPLDEPRSTDLVPLAAPPEEDPSQKQSKQTGKVWRGVGSLMRRRMFPILQAAQQAWGVLSDEQKGQVTEFLNTPMHELVGMPQAGIDYFRQMLGMGPEEGGITSLPMDEAGRMARATEQGFNIDSYHGTREDFAVFEKGDLGYHFGTPEQASARLSGTRDRADWIPHSAEENIIPVKLRLHNPLELPDVGTWQRPEVIIRRVLQTKWGESHDDELQELHDAAEELSAQFSDIDEWVDSPESSEIMDELRDMIKKDGYDGIKYRNIVETKSGTDPYSYIVFDAENIRSRFAEFDPAQLESPDISKAAGGFIDKPFYDRAV